MFTCKPHWFKLPKDVRDAVWREYRAGQEIDKKPSYRYLAVQQFAASRLAFGDGHKEVAEDYLRNAVRWQEKAIESGSGDPLDTLIAKRVSR